MRQLSPLDAVFVSLETPETPAHMGALSILDPSTWPEFCFESLKEIVGSRLRLCPRFGWKLQEVPLGLDLPYWVEDERFDLDFHVRRVAVPSPGGLNEVAELAGLLHSRPLDRTRALWEVWVIEGLKDGRVGMLLKTHHCLMDGVSGAGLADLICDLQPEPAECPLLPTDAMERVGPVGSRREMARNGLRNAFARPGHLGRHLRNFGASAVDRLRAADTHALPSSVPRAPFNGTPGSQRVLACAKVAFERVKTLTKHFDVTINDLVLAITGGAVRRHLERQGELPDRSLVALVPMSTRSKGDKRVGNQITECSVNWATDVEDPEERLYRIHASAEQAKASAKSSGANLMRACGEALPPGLFRLIYRGAMHVDVPLPGNAVVSNVRGASFPFYIAGAKMEALYPMSVLAPTQGLNITVMSYYGHFFFGITADPDLVAEPWLLAEDLEHSLRDLEEAAERRLRRAG